MKIALASDHAGYEMRQAILAWLQSPEGGKHDVMDMGCGSPESCDYPDFAVAVGRAIGAGRIPKGILLCGSGIGMSIAANKIKGVRAALVWLPELAALASEHNKANILCLPSRFMSIDESLACVKAFLKTPFGGGRHARRVRKITALEKNLK